jgi:hypothetical protein
MKFRRRQFLQLTTGLAALLTTSRVAKAQAYPTRPIWLLVSAGPGSAVDVIPRGRSPEGWAPPGSDPARFEAIWLAAELPLQ